MSETYNKMKEDLNAIVENAVKETEEKYMKIVNDIVKYLELGFELTIMISNGANYEQYKDKIEERRTIESELLSLKYIELENNNEL